MEKVIEILNRMQADGVIEKYAIGGGIAAIRYLEAYQTDDIDVFVLPVVLGESGLVSLEPIYTYLENLGYHSVEEGIGVWIGDWPVQFLPTASPLAEEALAQAVEKDVGGTPARVFTAEHLAAIALQTGRAKDKARLLQFWESGALDTARFREILARHNLVPAWEKFERQFLAP